MEFLVNQLSCCALWIASDLCGCVIGGGGEIRTHGRVAPTAVFKTAALNRSATPPIIELTDRNHTFKSSFWLVTAYFISVVSG